MADKRISQLVDRGTVANNDVVPIVVSGATTTNKATISSIQTFMQGNLDLGVTSVGITLGSSGTDVSVSGSPITSSGNITINLPTASATNRGLLSSANWTTFNNKVSSVGLSMPSAFAVANSPITGSGTIAVTGAGTVAQYIRGDGSLADFPSGGGGGGSSVNYYLNGSVSQGTIGGVAYLEMNKTPILGAGTDFTIAADGYIASFITDAGDPALLEIPAGNWNFESYFSASSGGGNPSFYIELYKVNSGGTASLIASSSATPELISFGTSISPYFSPLAVPTTVLTVTDRLAVRYYVTHSGRTITLHTENSHLCQIITTFTTGLTALNGLTAQVQNFATGTSGTDFAISSSVSTHTFNLPDASATARGVVTTGTQTIAGAKTLTSPLNGTTSIFSSAFASNQTSKVGIGFDSGYGRINAWGADASTYGGLSFEVSHSNGDTYQALRINPTGDVYIPAGGYYGSIDAAFLKAGGATAYSQALTPPVAKFINSANNFVKIALGQGETYPNFNDYYGIIALDNAVNLADNKLRFYLGYDDAVTGTHSNDQLVIQGDGNVGIGTATPSAKLHVMGTATLTGALNGTSALFSSTLETTGLLSRKQAAGNDGYIAYLTTGVQNTVMGFNNSGSTNTYGVLNNHSYFGNLNAYGLQLITNGAVALTLASTGTATFSGNAFISKASPLLVLNDTSGSGAQIGSFGGNLNLIDNATGTKGMVMSLSTGAATFSSSVATSTNFNVTRNGSNSVQAGYLLETTSGTLYLANQQLDANGGLATWTYNPTNGWNSRMTLTTAGNVIIGGTVSGTSLNTSLTVNNPTAGNYSGLIAMTADTQRGYYGGTSTGLEIGVAGSGFLGIYTSGTERMRITSGGFTKARANGGNYFGGGYHEFVNNNNVSGDNCLAIGNVAGSNTNNTSSKHLIVADSAADRLYIYGNGNVVNVNNSYGSLSDIKLKENIEDATPKLDDLMKVKIRNYNLIGEETKQIGVIAQELEEVFPAMIDDSEDFEYIEVPQLDEEGNEILNEEGEVVTEKQRVSKGTSTKSVKYSVFVPMLIKAIQELKTEIDSLKNQMK